MPQLTPSQFQRIDGSTRTEAERQIADFERGFSRGIADAADAGSLRVKAFWPEAGIRLIKARRSKLETELARLAAFAGCDRVEFLGGWERETLRQG